MSLLPLLLLLPLVALAGIAPGTAQGAAVRTPHVEAELVARAESVAPGGRLRAGLRLKLEPGWHVYWKNPGDSGLAPKLQWEPSSEGRPGELEFPRPERIPVPPLMNFGYEGELLLPFWVDVAPGAAVGGELKLQARASWLVCQETCIPGRATLELAVPVRAGRAAADEDRWSALFRRAHENLPRALPAGARAGARRDADGWELSITGWPEAPAGATSAWAFFPDESGLIENAAAQRARRDDHGVYFRLSRAAAGAAAPPERFAGIWDFGPGRSFAFDARVERAAGSPGLSGEGASLSAAPTATALPAATASAAETDVTLGLALAFAFLGGLLLNLMPCVFPVLSLKVMALARERDGSARERALSALAYAGGIFATFWGLVALLLALRAGGDALGWGFQLQSPAFVLALALLLFGLGLNFAGVFGISATTLVGSAGKLAPLGGAPPSLFGSFLTGVAATVLATPCTAPFMGTALGYALAQSPVVTFAVFSMLAAGLALPYVLIATVPAFGRLLPRPGAWMEMLRQALAFPLFATVVWLLWVFGLQTGANAQALALFAIVSLGALLWLEGDADRRHRRPSRARRLVQATLLIAALALARAATLTGPPAPGAESIRWQPWSVEAVSRAQAEGRPVFVDFTAAWCVTCQVNEATALSSESIGRFFRERQVLALKGDWTNADPTITAELARHGRSGVPLYLVFPGVPGAAPRALPQVLTEGFVVDAIRSLTGSP